MKNVMQEDQKGWKNNIPADEGQITAARANQREDGEEDGGIRPKKTKVVYNNARSFNTWTYYDSDVEVSLPTPIWWWYDSDGSRLL